ncbi:hypothetical protein IF2G_10721 [Cordyceps javanica]|nr:hypothetical protein IF2G_10721 [Cordyceps javanica]
MGYISSNTKQSFIEHYESEKPPDGGELFYKTRKYQGRPDKDQADPASRKWWQARCSKQQLQAISRLRRREEFMMELDSLYYLKALHPDMLLGSVARLISIGGDEELCHAFKQVRIFWWDIFGGDTKAMETFSRESLEQLEGSAPGANLTQRRNLRCEVQACKIFGEFSTNEDNAQGLLYFTRIVANTKRRIVPSLDVIFKNLVYLERVTLNIKQLLPPMNGRSIRETLKRYYHAMPENAVMTEDADAMKTLTGKDYRWIQTDAATLQLFECQQDRFELFVRQVWVAAFRIIDSKPPSTSSRTPGSEKDIGNPYALYQLSLLAQKLGFQTCASVKDRLDKPDHVMAHHALGMSIQPGCSYMREEIDPIAEKLAYSIYITREDAQRLKSINERSQERGGGKIFGIPGKGDFQRDWPNMFLPKLHSSEPLNEYGASMSSYFVFRSLYFTLLGGDEIELGKPVQGNKINLRAQWGGRLSNRSAEAELQKNFHLRMDSDLQVKLDNTRAKLQSAQADAAKQEQEKLFLEQTNNALQNELTSVRHELARARQVVPEDRSTDTLAELAAAQADVIRQKEAMARAEETALQNELTSVRHELARARHAEETYSALQNELTSVRHELARARQVVPEDGSTDTLAELAAAQLEAMQQGQERDRVVKLNEDLRNQLNSVQEQVADMKEDIRNKKVASDDFAMRLADLHQQLKSQGVRIVTTSGTKAPKDDMEAMYTRRLEHLKPDYSFHCWSHGRWAEVTTDTFYTMAMGTGLIVAKHRYESEENIQPPDFYGTYPFNTEIEERQAIDDLLTKFSTTLETKTPETEIVVLFTTSCLPPSRKTMHCAVNQNELERFASEIHEEGQGCLYCHVTFNGRYEWKRVTHQNCWAVAKANKHAVVLFKGKEEFPSFNFLSGPDL